MDSKQKYKVLGLMSGTSLDGVDVAFCTFQYKNQQWQFKIEKAITVAYNASWLKKLSQAHQLSAQQLLQLHAEYGKYLGTLCKRFFYLYGIKKVDFIASHGHTIFHQPVKGFTFQLGCGYALHAAAGKPVVCDFRSMDVALGGEGAPLVPIGDQYLFSDYDVCLNLGGIANLSQQVKGQRIAYDICFANMGLNYLAEKKGKLFDRDGALAADGTMDENMLKKLSMIYKRIETKRPSLGREFFEQHFVPVLNDETILLNDRLHTFTESVALQIASAVNYSRKRISVFCTGGGAFNAYLVYRLVEHFGDRADLIIPEHDIIKYKEALVFAFLGVKRVRHEPNCLMSVTKAERDSSGGVLIGF
ncbi:MAG: anhydro-N-acetylmuramic acid kinase [Cyclobacteriaceae bacterium]|nr:anhydro-N-acetylmuramic acid kinase [Cyclobacteriaceae bacterium]UYN86502.1 MAG: anhydro-N-acetylmuramic acid kinase [Cyclobacteriaceae bacterium]